ncbi:MAG: hypothetical protein AAB649_00545 [Patescibacteria group bacterium]
MSKVKVRIYLTVDGLTHQFIRDYELCFVPQEHVQQRIKLSDDCGYILAAVSSIMQYLDDEFFQVVCKTTLKSFCLLYVHNTGWKLSDPAAFQADLAVAIAIRQITAEQSKSAT